MFHCKHWQQVSHSFRQLSKAALRTQQYEQNKTMSTVSSFTIIQYWIKFWVRSLAYLWLTLQEAKVKVGLCLELRSRVCPTRIYWREREHGSKKPPKTPQNLIHLATEITSYLINHTSRTDISLKQPGSTTYKLNRVICRTIKITWAFEEEINK